MKRKHKVPTPKWYETPESAVVEPEYQKEVDQSTRKAELEYRIRQQRLAVAEENLAQARADARARKHAKATQQRLAELQAIVELRRQELEAFYRQMKSVAASVEHRGRKGYRPVPPTHGIDF